MSGRELTHAWGDGSIFDLKFVPGEGGADPKYDSSKLRPAGSTVFGLNLQPFPDPNPRWMKELVEQVPPSTHNIPRVKVHEDKLTAEDDEFNNSLSLELAAKALQYYKKKTGLEYELVRIVGRGLSFNPKYWAFHLSFQAKQCKDDLPHIFFAEVYQICKLNYKNVVKYCERLDPSSAADTGPGCSICNADMPHPVDFKFLLGPPEEKDTSCAFREV